MNLWIVSMGPVASAHRLTSDQPFGLGDVVAEDGWCVGQSLDSGWPLGTGRSTLWHPVSFPAQIPEPIPRSHPKQMKVLLTLCLSTFLLAASLRAELPPILLWPDGAPGS